MLLGRAERKCMFRHNRDYGEMRTTHVQDRLSGAEDGDWDDARRSLGSILAHCDYEVHGMDICS